MPETNPSPITSDRPMSRGTAVPIQRGNYGVPPRRTPVTSVSNAQPLVASPTVTAAPQQQPIAVPTADLVPPTTTPPVQPNISAAQAFASSGPKMMDVAIPRPSRPAAIAPVLTTAVPTQSSFQPAFTPAHAVASAAPSASSVKSRNVLRMATITLLVLGAIILIAGAGRFITAGSTSGHNIAVGAVAANDGKNMTIQFTADDGLMHKFTTASSASMIPGTAVEVAYRAGAADNTVKQVATINNAKSLGVLLLAIGGVTLAAAGVLGTILVKKTRSKNA